MGARAGAPAAPAAAAAMMMAAPALLVVVAMLSSRAAQTASAGGAPLVLKNAFIDATIEGAQGLTLLQDRSRSSKGGQPTSFAVAGDSVAVGLVRGGNSEVTLAPGAGLTFLSTTQDHPSNVTQAWKVDGGGELNVIFQLQQGSPALTKQFHLKLPTAATVDTVQLYGTSGFNISRSAGSTWATDYGKPESLNRALGCHRCSDGHGVMVTVSNPFPQLKSSSPGTSILAGYGSVGIAVGPAKVFSSDLALIAPYKLGKGWVRPHSLNGGADPSAQAPAMLNSAERDKFVEVVTSQLLYSPQDGVSTVKTNVAWDENDYQIDLASTEGRAECEFVTRLLLFCALTHSPCAMYICGRQANHRPQRRV